MEKTLEDLRKEIDSIDNSIIDLLEKRFITASEIGRLKKKEQKAVTDKEREKYVIKNAQNKASFIAVKETIPEIFESIIKLNRSNQIIQNLPTVPFSSTGILGFGVIGGSIAKAVKLKDENITINTVKRDSPSQQAARNGGYIDHEYETMDELVQNCELIIIASPIEKTLPIANEIFNASQNSNKRVIVIDVASVKKPIAQTFEEFTNNNVEFLMTHPMAGSETQGFEGSKGFLFINKPWIIVPHKRNSLETLHTVTNFVTALGSNPIQTSAEQHDIHVASVSHLVFLLSVLLFTYCASERNEALLFAGSGFESTTRLASGNAEMHDQIMKENYKNIQHELQQFLQYVEKNNINENSLDFFKDAKQKRDELLKTLQP